MIKGGLELNYRGVDLRVDFEYEPSEHFHYEVTTMADGKPYSLDPESEKFFDQEVWNEAVEMYATAIDHARLTRGGMH